MTNPTENLLKSRLEEQKQQTKQNKKTIINMARAAIKQLPREELINILIQKKIIMKDWEQKGNKYMVRQ